MSARGFSFVKPKIKVGSLKDRRDDFEKLVKHSDRGMATGQASSGIVLSPEAKANNVFSEDEPFNPLRSP